MTIKTITIGASVHRHNFTENQKVVLVGRNVVLLNEIGFYHTVSREALASEYSIND